MDIIVVLILAVLSILFLLVGTFIVFYTHNNKSVMTFSVSLGFIVLLLLGIFHFIPESYEFFRESFSVFKSILYLTLFGLLGFFMIFGLDKFGGHHHEEGAHLSKHYAHISLITCIFLVVHNFIEGMTLYSTVLLNYQTAVFLTLGIGLHNIPLGFTLSSTYSKNHNKFQTVIYILFIGLSYLFGAGVAYILNDILVNEIILGIALIFTFGMTMYIALFEFLPDIINCKEKKMRNLGFVLGIIAMFFSLFL